MTTILGLDLGTNSIGWAVIDTTKEGNQIEDKGVYIFTEGVKMEKGNEQSRAAERTDKRSARRIKFRRKLRKYEVLKVLIENGMCPLGMGELQQWRYNKKYPTSEEFSKWLRTDEESEYNPYRIRAEAATKKLPPKELGRAFYHLAQRRGFLSNRLDSSKDSNENGKVESSINDLTQRIKEAGLDTLGQYSWELYQKGDKVRGNYTAREDHYVEEFKKICKVQGLDDQLTDALERAIFYQRPLKSQKGLVGKCSFEKDKPRCPVSHPLFEEYRALQFINSIKYKNEDGQFIPLTDKERPKIWPKKFLRKSKPNFDFLDISKALTPKSENRWNYSPKTAVSGCPVIAQLVNIFDSKDWNDCQQRIYDAYTKKEKKGGKKSTDEVINDVWHVLFTFDKESLLADWAKNKLGLNDERAKAFTRAC